MQRLLTTTVAVALLSTAHAAPLTINQSANIAPISSLSVDLTAGQSPVYATIDRAVSFGKFNAGTGVLTGVSSTLGFTHGSALLLAFGTKDYGHSGTPSFASQATISAGSSLPGLAAFGAINQTLANSCSGDACFPHGVWNLVGNTSMFKTDASWLSPTATVAQGSLDSYVGTGAIASTMKTATSLSLQTENRIDGGLAKFALLGLTGKQSLAYSYLRHANASFTAASDTNVLGLGASSFSVFNLGDSSTTKLDFVSLQCVSGNCGAFDVTLPSFQDLAAGGSISGNAALATNVAGDYAATYQLVFSDDTAIGASSTHLQNSLTLNLQGSVPAVPEPGNWALLSLGLIGLAFRRRKQ
jgi:hypothetical protein